MNKGIISLSTEEINKCKSSPYYFATNYLIIAGKKFTTMANEDEFNKLFNNIEEGKGMVRDLIQTSIDAL